MLILSFTFYFNLWKMNLNNKPYSIYCHDTTGDNDALWLRIRSFKSMKRAMQSFKELTKTKKEGRKLIYIILPNNNDQRRYIVFKDEHKDDVLKSAK